MYMQVYYTFAFITLYGVFPCHLHQGLSGLGMQIASQNLNEM